MAVERVGEDSAAPARRVIEAIGHLVIVEVPGGYVVEDWNFCPYLQLTGVVPYAEAQLAVGDALERYARKLKSVSKNS